MPPPSHRKNMFLIDDILFIAGAALLGGAVGGAVGGVVGACIGFAIDVFLDSQTLRDEVSVRYPDAVKLLIQEKKKKAVNVGISETNCRQIASNIDITTSKGVSDNLYVGQEIYL